MDTTTQTPETGNDLISPQQAFDSPQQGEQVQQTQEPTPVQPTQQPSQAPITSEMIAKAVQTGLESTKLNVQLPQQPRSVTPEEQAEFDRQFNVFRATPENFKAVFGVAPQNQEQLKAFESQMHQVAKQGIAMSTYLARQDYEKRIQDLESRFSSQISPIAQAHQAQQAQAIESEFMSKYQDLKDYSELVKEVALATQAQKIPFKSKDEAFNFVADRVRGLLGKAAPGTTPNQTRSASPRRNTMTPLSGGGRPGQNGPLQPGGNTTVITPQDVFKEK